MDFGALLSRSWEMIWNNKFLIVLGIIVAFTSGSSGTPNWNTGGPNFGGVNNQYEFNWDDFTSGEYPLEDLPTDQELESLLEEIAPGLGIAAAILIPLLCVVFAIAMVFWAVGQIAQGGLIAGSSSLDAGLSSSFTEAWSASWRKGWRIVGIGLIPAIPNLVFLIVMMGLGLAAFGVVTSVGEEALIPAGGGLMILFITLACVLGLVSLVVSLLQTFAIRSCVIEDTGVFESYTQGFGVLSQNIGSAIVLFVIQFVLGIGFAIVLFFPALCCILWPLLLVVNGGVKAFFSTAWTLAYREWQGIGTSPVVVEEAPPAV